MWWSRFNFNNLGLTLGINLKFYISVAKVLKLKVRKFWGLFPAFVVVEKVVLNRVKDIIYFAVKDF